MNALFQLLAPWDVRSMGELCFGGDASIQTGPFGSQLHASDYVQEGIPCVMPQDIRDGRVSTDNIARISEEDHQRLNRFHLRKGDIVYPRRGDISKRALIGDREAGWLCGTGCLRIRPNTSFIDSRFLAYYLSHPDVCAWIEGNAVGATMPHLNTGLAGSIPVACPSLDEQNEIAAILGALDDKIELNRKMAATLEEMARALYRSWFVDFDPVHAKAQGRAPAHMDPTTAALFPDRFGEDGLPEGWERTATLNLVNFTKGRSYKSKELQPSTTALISLKSFQRGGGYRHDGLKAYTGTFKPEQVVFPGELVISLTDVTQAAELIGRATFVRSAPCYDTLVASLDVGILRPVDVERTPSEFLHQTFNSHEFLSHALAHTSGTTVLHLAKEAIPNFEMLLPDRVVSKAFETIVGPMREKIFQLETESETLAQLRDTLLPKLMSGELRIRDAEKQVGEVV